MKCSFNRWRAPPRAALFGEEPDIERANADAHLERKEYLSERAIAMVKETLQDHPGGTKVLLCESGVPGKFCTSGSDTNWYGRSMEWARPGSTRLSRL